PIYSIYTEQCKITLSHFGRTYDANDAIALLQPEALDLRRRYINIVGTGFIIIVHRTQKAVAVGQNFERSLLNQEGTQFGLYLLEPFFKSGCIRFGQNFMHIFLFLAIAP